MKYKYIDIICFVCLYRIQIFIILVRQSKDLSLSPFTMSINELEGYLLQSDLEEVTSLNKI